LTETASIYFTAVEVRSWADKLTSESHGEYWTTQWYVWPDPVRRLARELNFMRGGVIVLIGLQGVGKSSALKAICTDLTIKNMEAQRKASEGKRVDSHFQQIHDILLFKWRRQSELFESLLLGTHEVSYEFLRRYCTRLLELLRPQFPRLDLELEGRPERLNTDWAEKKLGKAAAKNLRKSVWLKMLADVGTILIDTPDYSKTDRRLAAKDLDEIYWLWNYLAYSPDKKPNLIITIQKEMFGRHYFFDKMTKIELQPLRPEQMLEAYKLRFKVTRPFTEDALLLLAKMSRGIFRRFLRYIALTLDKWLDQGRWQRPIDTEIVKKAITAERMAEDMEPEMQELFPKQNDLRLQAVRTLIHLDESGPLEQSQLAEQLDIKLYTMSRILAKLELHRYIKRKRSGNDKIVSLSSTFEKESSNSPSKAIKTNAC